MISVDYAYAECLNLDSEEGASMTLDEKIRYGMLALGGLSVVFAALGIHPAPLEPVRGWGTS